jgi:hypothetical protein
MGLRSLRDGWRPRVQVVENERRLPDRLGWMTPVVADVPPVPPNARRRQRAFQMCDICRAHLATAPALIRSSDPKRSSMATASPGHSSVRTGCHAQSAIRSMDAAQRFGWSGEGAPRATERPSSGHASAALRLGEGRRPDPAWLNRLWRWYKTDSQMPRDRVVAPSIRGRLWGEAMEASTCHSDRPAGEISACRRVVPRWS